MIELFFIRIILSFLIAGIWITLVTILSERFGTKIGGLLGNLPSNTLVTLFFIGLTQTPEFAATAARAVPIGMMIDSVFLFVFIVTAKKYGNIAFIFAFASWFLLAIPFGTSNYSDILIGTLTYIILTLILFYLLEYKLHIISVERKSAQKYSINELLMRAIFAGGIVAGTVVIAEFLGPVWGGIFSTFPAVMTSTMYILTKSQGLEFARATGKIMLLASANIVVYGIAVSITYPIYGLIIGTVISYIVAAAFVVLVYPLMKKIK